MKIFAIANHKGGVGKTTSAQNIAAYLGLTGKKVLLIDLDSQANLTQCFGKHKEKKTIYDSISDGEPLNIVKINENLSIVPANNLMAGVDREIQDRILREYILKDLIKPVENDFDYCILDCPPSLGIITVNALASADYVLIPMEAEVLAYNGIKSLKEMIDQIKVRVNTNLIIKGVFFTNMKPKLRLSKAMSKLVNEKFKNELCKNSIRTNVSLAECQISGKHIFEYDPESQGAQDYKALVDEILIK